MTSAAPTAPRAFLARPIAHLLISDKVFMQAYKAAARAERILAITHKNRSYVAVLDQDILERVLAADASLKHYAYDPSTQAIDA